MAKAKTTVFFCKECGYESAKWMGQCPACREWNTFVEAPAEKKEPRGLGLAASRNLGGPYSQQGKAGGILLDFRNWTECWEMES